MLASLVALAVVAAPPAVAVDGCARCHPPNAAWTRAHRVVAPPHAAVPCAGCHRGVAAGTSSAAAHGGAGADALLAGAAMSAGCVSCHVLGAAGTEPSVRGLDLYLEHGCALCHRALGFGAPDAFGPALDAIGQRDPAYLRAVLERPSRFFPGTPMPPHAHLFHHAPQDGAALIAFLRGLRGAPRKAAGPAAALACASCHATARAASAPPAASASPASPAPPAPSATPAPPAASAPAVPPLARHACPRIRAEARALSCARCHGKDVPSGPRECLFIDARRDECAGCHEVPR